MTVAHKSAAELEREVEAQRAGLALTLDAISSRLTPGQILDEALQFARGSGSGAFVRNFGAGVRDNPLPVGLIASGIAWFMSGRGSVPRTPEENLRRMRDRKPAEDFTRLRTGRVIGDSAQDDLATEEAPGVMARAAGSASDMAADARDRLSEAAAVAGDAGRIAMEDARHSADRLGRSAAGHARQLRDRTLETSRHARERAEAFADDQPVVLAVAGLAIGALFGAIARSTAAESRLMGKASDDLKDRAMDAAEGGAEKLAGVAERTYAAVREEAENEGLTTSTVREAADEVTRKVKKVARKAQAQIEEELSAASGSQAETR